VGLLLHFERTFSSTSNACGINDLVVKTSEKKVT